MSHREQQKAEARERRLAAERAQAERNRKRRLVRLGILAAAAIAAIVAIVLLASGGDDDSPGAGAGSEEAAALFDGIPQSGTTLGNPDAKLVLTEFADLQCPFCAQYATDVLPELVETYVRPGRLRLDLRILEFLGFDSQRGAHAAYEAAEADRMWQFVDAWYRNQGPENSGYADDDFIGGLAEEVGLDRDAVLEAAEALSHPGPIEQAKRQAGRANIDSTPSFLLGRQGGRGERIEVDSLTFEAFRDALEPELE